MGSADSRIRRYKFKAARLHSNLNSEDSSEHLSAAQRFSALETFNGMTPEQLVARRKRIKHRHALEVIAREAGFKSWKDLIDDHDTAWYPRKNSLITDWFDTYNEARECLEEKGGYLLTFRGRYFIACAEYIEILGLDPDDRLWREIGFDCKRPADKKAMRRLLEKLESSMEPN